MEEKKVRNKRKEQQATSEIIGTNPRCCFLEKENLTL